MTTENILSSASCSRLDDMENSEVLKRKCREIGQSSPSMMWKRSIVQATAVWSRGAAVLALVLAVCAVSSLRMSPVPLWRSIECWRFPLFLFIYSTTNTPRSLQLKHTILSVLIKVAGIFDNSFINQFQTIFCFLSHSGSLTQRVKS